MICQLPEEKLENIKELCKDISTSPRVMVMNIQGLMGCVISSRPAVSLTRARSRGILGMVLKHYKRTTASTKKLVALTDWIREKAMWWINVDIEDCNMFEECPHLGDLEAGNRRHGHRSGVCV